MKAPWSNQPVSLVARAGAGFFAVLGVLVLVVASYSLLSRGGTEAPIWFMIYYYVVCTYFTWLFGHVALRGRAPAGWLPSWRSHDGA